MSGLRVVLRASWASMGTRRERSTLAKLACLIDWAVVRPSCIAAWLSGMIRDVLSRRNLVRTEVHTLEVVWLSLAGLVGLGVPTPANLTGRDRRVRSSGGWRWGWCLLGAPTESSYGWPSRFARSGPLYRPLRAGDTAIRAGS